MAGMLQDIINRAKVARQPSPMALAGNGAAAAGAAAVPEGERLPGMQPLPGGRMPTAPGQVSVPSLPAAKVGQQSRGPGFWGLR